MIHLSNPSDDCDTHFFSFFFFFQSRKKWHLPPQKTDLPTQAKLSAGVFHKHWARCGFSPKAASFRLFTAVPLSAQQETGRGERALSSVWTAERSREVRRGEDGKTFLILYSPPKKTLQTWVCTAPTRNFTPWARGVTRDRIWRALAFEVRCSPVGTASRTFRTAEGTPTPPSPGAPCTAGGSGRWKWAAAAEVEVEVEWGETF